MRRRRSNSRQPAVTPGSAEGPRPPGCVVPAGEDTAYRVCVGDYRILYEVIDEGLIIQVVRVGHRRGVYRPR
ncbi:MAG: type II toxin-antitoxin system RelE/ParE family toxin [Actinobacteria bacterium]|nr:type II toxin-antitoxin system RelE/ParE family toxin [Actinomycetota bacterium]